MNSARRCSALFSQICVSSVGGQPARTPLPPAGSARTPLPPAGSARTPLPPAGSARTPLPPAGSAATGTRCCHTGPGGGVVRRTSGPLKPGASASSITAPVCPMGSSSSSSSSRLFGSMAQVLSSSSLAQPDPDLDQDQDMVEVELEQLLRECEEALRRRPARPHRDLVQTKLLAPCSHQHNPSIRVLQWNILAQALSEGKDSFIRCPLEALSWHERKYQILEEILTYRPDIVCLQEVDHYYDTFQPIMASLGYHGNFLPKPWSPCLDVEHNNGPDGCALFYRRSRFHLHSTAHLRLSAMMLPTNQVAIAQTLRCLATGRQLCVAVTHLKARSGWERLRSAQGADLLQNLQGITAPASGAGPVSVPLVVCGDFNAEPSEDVYRRFSSSPLGLSSAYKMLSGDGLTEPVYTSWKIRPSGESCSTLDYIWYSERALRVEALLDIPTEQQIGPDRLPSYHYPSDHLALLCDISFREEPHRLL